MKKIYIIKAGTTFPEVNRTHGDFDLWTLNSMGLSPDDANVIDVQNNEPLPSPDECRGVVITGSHAMVTEHLHWSDNLLKWIPGIVNKNIPYMGICYGHQLLAEAMGGHVGFHPGGKEIGTAEVVLSRESDKDPLFNVMPERFPVHVTHSQCVLKLPPGAVPLASNDFEHHHAFRLRNCAWGVQFHPEYNIEIIKAYILEQADELNASGRNTDDIMATVKETPESANLMKKFADFIMQNFEH